MKAYIKENYNDAYESKKLKLWIAGYSRGAAVSNVLSYLILGDNEKKLNIEPENVFCYTYATPRGLIEEHAIDFPNVFNIISEADIVTHVAPVEYGFYRCGMDKVIFDGEDSSYTVKSETTEESSGGKNQKRWYTSKVDKILADFDEAANLPKYMLESKSYSEGEEPEFTTEFIGEKKLIVELFEILTEKDGSSTGGYSFKTRELYADTVQPHIAYFTSILLSDMGVLTDLSKLVEGNKVLTKGMSWIREEDAFYNDLMQILNSKNIPYNSEELKGHCDALLQMLDYTGYNGCLTQAVFKIMPMAIGDRKDLQRIIYQHSSDVIYAQLKAMP